MSTESTEPVVETSSPPPSRPSTPPSSRRDLQPIVPTRFDPDQPLRKPRQRKKNMVDPNPTPQPPAGTRTSPVEQSPPGDVAPTAPGTAIALTLDQVLKMIDYSMGKQQQVFTQALREVFPAPQATPPRSPEVAARDIRKLREEGIKLLLAPHSNLTPREAFTAVGMTESEAAETALSLRPSEMTFPSPPQSQHSVSPRGSPDNHHEGTSHRNGSAGTDYSSRGPAPHQRFERRGPDQRPQSYEANPHEQERPPRRDLPMDNSSRPPPVKPEDLGQFDGSSTSYGIWMSTITAYIHFRPNDQAWHDAIVRCIPFCLKEGARFWYTTLDDESRSNLRSWDRWVAEMNLAFRPNPTVLADLAEARKWDGIEDISLYYYAKLALLRQAYPDRPVNSFARQIKAGLPQECQGMVRTVMSHNPELKYLLNELREQEDTFKKMIANQKKIDSIPMRGNTNLTPSSAPSTLAPMVTTTVRQETTRTASARRFNTADLKATFRADGLFKEGNTVKYRVPGTSDVMVLNRNCKMCDAGHWDWMHDLLQPKGSVNVADAELFWVEQWDEQSHPATGDNLNKMATIEAPPSAKITEIPSPSAKN
ncbi:hypothetical protein BCV69DRAFT_296012 [Microstroma glucosiphilum]|uniref:Retrotransposon gag domain-containing protein n=1 Tax=Pseudomicrostroma glucosiphilum TaxID=1684307 RepID=A0A316UEN5_9BASI|nr:hypothetical protein BCV69DRAFT_296012 [Pseudomicrostroma glucosiphilum]PWN23696.1 hypothetical protein BCV69DRAFT_296012 [Pseudomicrostroma glucosiphilum]